MRIHRHSGTEIDIIKTVDGIREVRDILPYMGSEYPQRIRIFAKSKAITLLGKLLRGDRVEIISEMIEVFERSTDTWLQRNILEVVSHFYSKEFEDYFLEYARNGKCRSEYIKDRILTLYDPAYRRKGQ